MTNFFQTTVQINHNLSALQNKTEFDPARVVNKNALPDVYLIVLDSYAREDILKQTFNDVEDFFAGINSSLKRAVQSPSQNKYTMIMSDLDYMESMASVPGPKLVYLHLPAPHTPQVLGPNGEFIKGNRLSGYTYAITYLNKRIFEIISKIIAQSKVPPVIILQGDHGYGEEGNNRVYNLNAYYLPGVDKSLVYPSITPVNTVRLIFNAYFGGQFELLKDASYLTSETRPMDFQLVPSGCPK